MDYRSHIYRRVNLRTIQFIYPIKIFKNIKIKEKEWRANLLVNHGLVIFLVEYIILTYSNPKNPRIDTIENIFSIAINDYIETHPEELNGNRERLEKIAQEFLYTDKKEETRNLLIDFSNGKFKRLYRKLQPFLLPLIYEGEE